MVKLARVDFQTKSATNVLKVSNAALRFKPTDEQLASLGIEKAPQKARTTTSTNGGQRQGRSNNGGQRPTIGTLYYLDANNKLATQRVMLGVSDGASTEIRMRNNAEIKEGSKVVAGIASATTTTASSTTSSSPFNNGGGQQRGGRGGF